MSQLENVETARRFTAAIQRGDRESAETELATKVEIDDQDIPDADGHDSFYAWIGRWNDAWESWRLEEVDFHPVGDDKVLALFRMIIKGKGSGIELSRDDATLCEFRDGKITRIGYYNDQQQARQAAGLDVA
jgi:ketosteroid isomerase-like protein